jgi:carboxymethylenebutenolidase
MKEHSLSVPTPDGLMPTFVAMPDGDGPFPPVVLFMDIWGMREQLRDVARFVAAEGYACAAPDLYYRKGSAHFDHRHDDGKTMSIFVMDADERQKMLDYAEQLTDDMAISDAGALIDAMRKIEGVGGGYAGSFGYCMGGRHVVKVAAAHPGIFRASASLHGTYLVTDDAGSPHRGAPNIQGEIYFGYGEKDSFTQPDVIDAVRDAFAGSPAAFHERVHADTDHGYAIPDRDVYNEAASREDWKIIFDMFGRTL